jgi:hypothetical protein
MPTRGFASRIGGLYGNVPEGGATGLLMFTFPANIGTTVPFNRVTRAPRYCWPFGRSVVMNGCAVVVVPPVTKSNGATFSTLKALAFVLLSESF